MQSTLVRLATWAMEPSQSLSHDPVWVYVDTSKQVGDRDHLKVFATEVAAEIWFKENDPEGVAFEYEVLE
jgi:hypothetical protein